MKNNELKEQYNTGLLRTAELQLPVKKEMDKKELKARRDRERELVKGVFKFYEAPGQTLRFVFRKWKEDPVETYELTDEEEYTIPLGVAIHLNENGWYPQNEYILNPGDMPKIMLNNNRQKYMYKVGKKTHRFGFQSMDFRDVGQYDNHDKKIVTVQHL